MEKWEVICIGISCFIIGMSVGMAWINYLADKEIQAYNRRVDELIKKISDDIGRC